MPPWVDWDAPHYPEGRAHDDTYITDGKDVVVLARYTGRHHHGGREFNVRVAHHYTVRGGRIVRFEQFVDSALVREAMR